MPFCCDGDRFKSHESPSRRRRFSVRVESAAISLLRSSQHVQPPVDRPKAGQPSSEPKLFGSGKNASYVSFQTRTVTFKFAPESKSHRFANPRSRSGSHHNQCGPIDIRSQPRDLGLCFVSRLIRQADTQRLPGLRCRARATVKVRVAHWARINIAVIFVAH
jgi:hypothetical protein